MLPTRESLPAELATLHGLGNIARAMKRNLAMVEGKIVAGTVNSSDVLDGLWDRENALPKWLSLLTAEDTALRTPAFNKLARDVTGNRALDIGADLDSLTTAAQQLVATIRAHPTLFNPDGSERRTISDVNGQRRSTVYVAGELDSLLPDIRTCLALFA